MRRVLFALLFLAAPIASARILFDPPRVHENEAFDILIRSTSPNSPGPGAPNLRLAPGQITVELMRGDGILTSPAEWGERVRVDGMPAGTYEVVFRSLDRVWERTTLVVHRRPFTVLPPFGDHGTPVLIEGVRTTCAPQPCTPNVRFGDRVASEVEVRSDGRILAVSTHDRVGPVDVSVEINGITHTLTGGFTGTSFGDPPDLSLMEKVLLPLNFRGNGAHGAEWRTHTTMRNDSPLYVATEPLFYEGMILPDLPGVLPLEPGSRGGFSEEQVEGGVYLFVPRGLETWLTYKSHILDRSRSATDRGTELPVVRVEDTSSVIRLIDIPLRPLFRSRLRLYDFDTFESREIDVQIARPDGTLLHHTVLRTHVPACVTPPCTAYRAPFAALELSSIPGLADAGLVDVTIRAETNDARLWAFVSASNNDTQRVTLYTPQHKTPGAAR